MQIRNRGATWVDVRELEWGKLSPSLEIYKDTGEAWRGVCIVGGGGGGPPLVSIPDATPVILGTV